MEEYKFQKLQVYQLALKYVNSVYALSGEVPATRTVQFIQSD